MRRLTTEEFIERAKLTHGDKYDYSLVEYIDSKTKVKIKCNKCGKIFEQIALTHLKKEGCECYINRGRKTTEQFIGQSKSKWGDRFDYSETVYINSDTKLKLKCNVCKHEIYQLPNNNIAFGCYYCSKIELGLKRSKIYSW